MTLDKARKEQPIFEQTMNDSEVREVVDCLINLKNCKECRESINMEGCKCPFWKYL